MVSLLEFLPGHQIDLPHLQGVVTTGEPLYPHQRDIIEKGFGTKVFNLYASREFGTTAAECSAHQDLHIAADSILIETTEEDKQLAPGQFGKILITDLHNYAMPMIRYEIGDYGQLSEDNCPCGLPYPLIKNVVGRISDVFVTADQGEINTHSLILHLIDEGPKVGQVQLVQKSIREILVRLTDNPYPDDSVKDFYVKSLKKLVAGLEVVNFEVVKKLENEKSGKYRFAICEVTMSDRER
jgi:phenylacetate-CoA ligase